MNYVFGEDTLDMLLVEGIDPGTLLLILGHPGAGKTAFAVKMLYENAMRYHVKGVYISFAETKEKVYSFMKRLGVDLKLAESKGLIEFIQMPTIAGKELLDVITSVLGKKIINEGYSIAVIDSITPILNVVTTDEARAYLHTTLYNIMSSTKTLLILVADMPFATETVDLKGLEFIADAVFVFKTRIEKGLIHRFMEIRKFRGRPIPAAEIPFSIDDGVGIRTLISPAYLRTPYTASTILYRDTCSDILWDPILAGSYIGIISECNVIPPSVLAMILRLIHSYGLYYGIVSFKEVPEALKNLLANIARDLKVLPHYILQKLVFIESLNPSAYSTQQVDAFLRSLLERNVNVIIIHGAESLYLYHDPLHVDRVLNSISMYAKSGNSVLIEFIDNIYTNTQLIRYNIIHKVQCLGDKVVHNVVRSRSIGVDLKSFAPISRIDDSMLIDCFEKHPIV